MNLEMKIASVIIGALFCGLVFYFKNKIDDLEECLKYWSIEHIKDTRELRDEVLRNKEGLEVCRGSVVEAKRLSEKSVDDASDALTKTSIARVEAGDSARRLNKLENHARFVKCELDGKTWIVKSMARNFVRFDNMGEIIGINSVAGATKMTKAEAEKVLERINSENWFIKNTSNTILKQIGEK